MNDLIDRKITINFRGEITCAYCNKVTKKSYQGYCYLCSKNLARCDLCIVKPELCHYENGTCREPEWGLKHCFQDHYLYLSNTSDIKIGVTRVSQVPIRWIDQGAIQALPIIKVSKRKLAGMIEVTIAKTLGDKTNWRKLLKQDACKLDLEEIRDKIFYENRTLWSDFAIKCPQDNIELLTKEPTLDINYPILEYPTKIASINLDKTPKFSDKLIGIKGQYLMFEQGVINFRKYTGYNIEINY